MYSTRYLFVLFFLFLFQFSSSQKQHFTKAQIQEDLGILKEQLLELHPNLMVYHSKAAFNIFFDHLDLPEHTSVEEAYGIIASTSAIIQDGHTLFYPDIQLIKERNGNGHFIPLKIFWDGSSLFIDENYSSNKNINPGTRIIAINGIYSEELIDFMLQRMMRDGNNLNYPIWVLNQYFFEYYSYFYGCPKTFRLMIEDNNGTQKEVALEGLLKADLFEERNANDKERKGIDIVLNQPNSTAILTIKDWHNSILKKYYQQNFKKEITQIFEYIKEKKIKNLVIDVRDNQGGDTQNSKLVLSYLLEQPFQLVEEYKVVKKGELVDAKGPQMG
ncbi:MAG: S41 family peptidase, partial [Bacteroidota bacterium]